MAFAAAVHITTIASGSHILDEPSLARIQVEKQLKATAYCSPNRHVCDTLEYQLPVLAVYGTCCL